MSNKRKTFTVPRPIRPDDDACCGGGCVPCVFDVYEKQLAAWEARREDSYVVSDPTVDPALSTTRYLPFELTNVRTMTRDTNVYTFRTVRSVSGEVSSIVSKANGEKQELTVGEARNGTNGIPEAPQSVTFVREVAKNQNDSPEEIGVNGGLNVDVCDTVDVLPSIEHANGVILCETVESDNRVMDFISDMPKTDDILALDMNKDDFTPNKSSVMATRTIDKVLNKVGFRDDVSERTGENSSENEDFINAYRNTQLNIGVGQYVIMKASLTDGKNISRAYTPISETPGRFDIFIKRYPFGEMSRHVSHLQIGDVVHFRGPFGEFRHVANRRRRLLMLCAGTGIAPMYRVARAIVDNEADETRVRLVCAVRGMDSAPLREEVRELTGYWNVEAEWWTTGGGTARYGERVVYGRLTEGAVRGVVMGEGRVGEVAVLVCGTKEFSEDMLRYVTALGVSDIHVF